LRPTKSTDPRRPRSVSVAQPYCTKGQRLLQRRELRKRVSTNVDMHCEHAPSNKILARRALRLEPISTRALCLHNDLAHRTPYYTWKERVEHYNKKQPRNKLNVCNTTRRALPHAHGAGVGHAPDIVPLCSGSNCPATWRTHWLRKYTKENKHDAQRKA